MPYILKLTGMMGYKGIFLGSAPACQSEPQTRCSN